MVICIYDQVILFHPPILCLNHLGMKYSDLKTKILNMVLKTLCTLALCAFPSLHAPVFHCLSALHQAFHPVHLPCFLPPQGLCTCLCFYQEHSLSSLNHLVKSFYFFRVHVLRKDFPATLIQVKFL